MKDSPESRLERLLMCGISLRSRANSYARTLWRRDENWLDEVCQVMSLELGATPADGLSSRARRRLSECLSANEFQATFLTCLASESRLAALHEMAWAATRVASLGEADAVLAHRLGAGAAARVGKAFLDSAGLTLPVPDFRNQALAIWDGTRGDAQERLSEYLPALETHIQGLLGESSLVGVRADAHHTVFETLAKEMSLSELTGLSGHARALALDRVAARLSQLEGVWPAGGQGNVRAHLRALIEACEPCDWMRSLMNFRSNHG